MSITLVIPVRLMGLAPVADEVREFLVFAIPLSLYVIPVVVVIGSTPKVTVSKFQLVVSYRFAWLALKSSNFCATFEP